jgi:(1->4)-alpha-D-glucan 1-alpha-D-glucosylmutase
MKWGESWKFGITIDEFHEVNQKQSTAWPYKMNATATHDTKRGEDVRARLNVLSEIPEEWEKQVKTWIEINRHQKSDVRGRAVPVPNDEYFFYQTLVVLIRLMKVRMSHLLDGLKTICSSR